MRVKLYLSIIIFFLTLAYAVSAQNEYESGSIPLNLSIYQTVSGDSILTSVNVTANNVSSVNAMTDVDTSIDFVSNTSLGNISITITRYPTSPVGINLSNLNAVSVKYVNMSANNTLNSSVLTWKIIKIYYTNAELDAAGLVEDSLAMYWYNTSSGQWTELTTSLDQVFDIGLNTTGKYVWTNSTLFSLYAIGGLKANGESCSVDAECYSNVCCNEVCQSSCTTVVTTTPTTAAGGGGGGGGGTGAPTTVTEVSGFIVDKDFIKVLLKPSGIKRKLIDISNVTDTDLSITIDMKNLEDFLIFPGGVSEYTFDLSVGETKSIQLNFFASEKQEPGVFPGKIIVTGNGVEKLITVVIEVELEEPLFDIDVKIPQKYQEVLPDEEVLIQLIIYNIKRIGPVDVYVEYGIKDFADNTIVTEHEVLAVEMQVSVVRSLHVPFDAKPDSYVAYATVKYDDTVGTGTHVFRVVTPKEEIEMQTIMVLLLLLFTVIIVLIFLFTIGFIERKMKELHKPKKMKKLRKPKRRKK